MFCHALYILPLSLSSLLTLCSAFCPRLATLGLAQLLPLVNGNARIVIQNADHKYECTRPAMRSAFVSVLVDSQPRRSDVPCNPARGIVPIRRVQIRAENRLWRRHSTSGLRATSAASSSSDTSHDGWFRLEGLDHWQPEDGRIWSWDCWETLSGSRIDEDLSRGDGSSRMRYFEKNIWSDQSLIMYIFLPTMTVHEVVSLTLMLWVQH